MVDICIAIRESNWFRGFIIFVICFASILVGMQTYPELYGRFKFEFLFLDKIILSIFILEVFIKVLAEGRQPWNYFKNPWNVFDFTIVVVLLMPINSHYAAVSRIARILRILRLITAVKNLQVIVGAFLKSIPSMCYVVLLLSLLFYCYAVIATFLFGANDPIHFGRLEKSLLSLFRAVTLEDWTDLMYIQMYGCANYGYLSNPEICVASQANPLIAAMFFVSFVLLGAFVILNLFIGIVLTSMEEMRGEVSKREIREIASNDEMLTSERLTLLSYELEKSLEKTKFLIELTRMQERIKQR